MVEEARVSISEMTKTPSGHFVLVHGISGGSWCWYKIKTLIENSGFRVSCINLKGSGIDCSNADLIHSFDEYNEPLIEFMSALPEGEKVILVGHSAGGLSITDATHKFANKISLAIYIAATMLQNGFLTDQDVKDGVPDISEFGDVYELGFGLGFDHPPTSALVKREYQRKIIYQLSPQEDSALASMLLRPGPIKAIVSAKFPNSQDINKVPRVYIKTTRDHVVKPDQQESMIRRWPPSDVYVLESDHSPFFSTPFLFFGLLVKAAASVGIFGSI